MSAPDCLWCAQKGVLNEEEHRVAREIQREMDAIIAAEAAAREGQEPIIDQFATFLRIVHPQGYTYLGAFRDTYSPVNVNVPGADADRVLAFANEHRAQRNIYFGVAPRNDPDGRAIRYCLGLWALFADFDFKDTPEADVRERLAAFPLPPSATIASGGGLHVYWFLSEPLYLVNATVRAKIILLALANMLGADPLSAEPARILRVPGTLNHKYDPPRPVTFEHLDETQRYALDKVLAVLPTIPETPPERLKDPVKHSLAMEARIEAAKRWLAERAPAVQGQGGDAHTYETCCGVLIDHDLDVDSALKALHDWNGRCQPPWSVNELKRKLYNAEHYSTGQRGSRLASRRLVITRASDIKPRPVHWFWKDRLPLGMVSLLAGREGIGKTTVAYTLVADTTRGQLPGRCFGTHRNVIIVATEDSWEHTVVPRLMAAGADLERVLRVNVEVREIGKLELSLPDDIAALEQVIQEQQAALVLLDPVISRLSRKIDTHKDAEVRSALEPLARLADATGACLLGIIHVNKSTSRDPLNMVMGSRAFVAVARAVLFVASDPDNEKVRLLGQPKNNPGRTDLPTLQFEIVAETVGETDEGPIITGKLCWTGESQRTIRSVVEDAAEGHIDRTAIASAVGWLNDYLASKGGWAYSGEIKKEGKKADHEGKTLERAARRAGLVISGFGFPRKTVWAFRNAEVPEQAEIDGSDGL